MRNGLFAKLALGCAGIFMCGGVAGVGLANYAASGSFEFYKAQRVSEWQPELPPQPAALQSTDLAFAPDHRSGSETLAPEESIASFNR